MTYSFFLNWKCIQILPENMGFQKIMLLRMKPENAEVLPMLKQWDYNLYSYAGTVCSDGTMKEVPVKEKEKDKHRNKYELRRNR